MLAALAIALAVLTVDANARHRWSQQELTPVPNLVQGTEPSSRDLDVGIAIGIPEDDNDILYDQSGGALNLAGISDPRGHGMIYSVPAWNQQDSSTVRQSIPLYLDNRQQYSIPNQQDIPVRAIVQTPMFKSTPLYPNIQQNPQRTLVQNQGFEPYVPYVNNNQYFVANPQEALVRQVFQKPSSLLKSPYVDTQDQLVVNRQNIPWAMSSQNSGLEPLSLYPVAEDNSQKVLVNKDGVPVMTARPYGERRVGAFRLRNDRGYQVTMEVPPSPTGVDKDGVLVMEMKATLYRPVQ